MDVALSYIVWLFEGHLSLSLIGLLRIVPLDIVFVTPQFFPYTSLEKSKDM